MEIARLTAHPLARSAGLYALWVIMFFLLFAKSWVSEDTYITFRVIDNFVNGYGLRWNANERVQVYTHPLWLLIHLPPALVWENLYLLNISISLICASAAVAVALLTFRHSFPVMVVLFVLPLFVSKCFIDYAGSGLETSLSYLLFAALGYALLHWQRRRHFLFIFSFFVALLLLNRLDHIILAGPLIAYIAWQRRGEILKWRSMGWILLGALPLICWLAFSLFYYGFMFPNTKYAKLGTDLPLSEYLAQGSQYIFIWLTQDTVSVLVVAAAVILAVRKKGFYRMIAAGILLNILYTVYIGGDYMMGRFFALPFFAAAWLLVASAPLRIRNDILFAAALAFITATAASYYVREIRKDCESCIPIVGRVNDARWTFGNNALFFKIIPPQIRTEGQYKFAEDGRKLMMEVLPPRKTIRYIGMQGYYAGARAILIDEHGLGDALIARLPAQKGRSFFAGHFRRDLPKGYMETIRTGLTDEMDPSLAQYYEKIKLITQGPLWDRQRLKAIVLFNLGYYDHYLYEYLSTTQ